MNSLKGLGVCLVLAVTAFAVAHVAKIEYVILAITIGTATMFTATFLASVWRYRWDRRMAGEGRRRRAAGKSAKAAPRTSVSA
ncbi:hypothetical protein ABIA38_007429 [Embleya sp. AB8]